MWFNDLPIRNGGFQNLIEEYSKVLKWDRRKFRSQTSDVSARKGRKVAIHYVFPMVCGSGGSKTRLAKAAGAELSGEMRDENLHVVVA